MTFLKTLVAVLLLAGTVTACTSTQRGATVGALTGAAIGGVTSGNAAGAVIGAAAGGVAGAVAGNLLGRYRDDPSQCVYEDRRGRQFIDDCPEG
jgi:phage tail tape-measure protein